MSTHEVALEPGQAVIVDGVRVSLVLVGQDEAVLVVQDEHNEYAEYQCDYCWQIIVAPVDGLAPPCPTCRRSTWWNRLES